MMHTRVYVCFCLPKLSVRDNDQVIREKKLEIVALYENDKTTNITSSIFYHEKILLFLAIL
jgi:hypothetical protein